tara:strand:- start:2177 stop:2758 length:582 start_codon:yes stop_codon:yes gene_type:complete
LKYSKLNRLVLIGASTGGPGHLQKIVGKLPGDYNAVVILAQHLGKEFMPSFVAQLQQRCILPVIAATSGLKLKPGHVYVCSGSSHLGETGDDIELLVDPQRVPRYNPDIDYLFESAALLVGRYPSIGIILTGIGDDGASGCLKLTEAGAQCYAEAESSAIVYGMPHRAAQLVNNINIEPIEKLIDIIVEYGSA